MSSPLTADIADTRALLPWIRVEAWPASKSNCACCRASCFCNSKTSALYASFASLQVEKWEDCQEEKHLKDAKKEHFNHAVCSLAYLAFYFTWIYRGMFQEKKKAQADTSSFHLFLQCFLSKPFQQNCWSSIQTPSCDWFHKKFPGISPT